jgi:hypothetical protein
LGLAASPGLAASRPANGGPPASSLRTQPSSLLPFVPDYFQQPQPDRVELTLVQDLIVFLIGHVKDVDDLVEIGA